eukprot:gene19671-25589_t
MGRFIQLVMGPAGVGKSTFCKIIQEHCRLCHRTIHVGNLDPAAENFQYESSFDIKDLINLDEVMNDLGYGPNDVSEEDSIEDVLARIDQAIQYGEDIEPKEPVDFDIPDDYNS